MQELKTFLIKQHYPEHVIEDGLQKEMSLDKNVLRTVTTNRKENIVQYVSMYNPRDTEMFNEILRTCRFYRKMKNCERFCQK